LRALGFGATERCIVTRHNSGKQSLASTDTQDYFLHQHSGTVRTRRAWRKAIGRIATRRRRPSRATNTHRVLPRITRRTDARSSRTILFNRH